MDGLDDELHEEVLAELKVPLHPRWCVITQGQVGGAVAVDTLQADLLDERLPAHYASLQEWTASSLDCAVRLPTRNRNGC